MDRADGQRKEIILSGFFSLRAEPECIVIREEGSPFVEAIMVFPFIVMAPIMGLVAAYAAAIAGEAMLSGSSDCPTWVCVLMLLVFGPGAVLCFWLFGRFCTMAFPVTHRIEESQCGLVCRSRVLGIPWCRRCLERPAEVVAQVYRGRYEWTIRVFLQDACKRRFHVVLPTQMVASRAAIVQRIKPFAEALADALGCSCVVR